MKIIQLALLFCSLFFMQKSQAQNPVNWTNKQLMEPAALANILTAEKHVPYIFSIGPGAIIPHSVAIGMTADKDNLDKFKQQLKGLDKKASIVVYCGCCPYEHCPNVRPAIEALKTMQFTNYKLLDLPHNITTDWISKGYPTIK
jgi:hypothetical protein